MYPIIDCHCHIYPEKIAAKAGEGISKFYGLPVKNGSTVQEMTAKAKAVGITHCIVFSVATKVSQVKSINSFIASEVARSNGFLTGLGTLHPDSNDISGDIEYLLSLGLKGVKLHPDFQQFKLDDYRCLKIYELCEGRLPVLVHTGDSRYDFSNPNRLKPILDTYTDLTVIGAHLGGWSVWDTAVDTLTGYKNFYVDTSSSTYWLSPERMTEIIRAYGADRVLFGTDFPVWDSKEEIERFNKLDLTHEEKEKIYYKNAQKLFGVII